MEEPDTEMRWNSDGLGSILGNYISVLNFYLIWRGQKDPEKLFNPEKQVLKIENRDKDKVVEMESPRIKKYKYSNKYSKTEDQIEGWFLSISYYHRESNQASRTVRGFFKTADWVTWISIRFRGWPEWQTHPWQWPNIVSIKPQRIWLGWKEI